MPELRSVALTGREHAVETLGAALARHARERPDAAAIVAAGRSWTYAQLDDLARAVAADLLDGDVPVHAPVAVDVADNALRAALVTAVGTGWTAVPLDPTMSPEARSSLLTRVQPAAVLTAPPTTEARAVPPAVGLDDPVVVVTTSGSTGVPKIIVNTHRNIAASAAAVAGAQDLGPDDRFLVLGSTAVTLGARGVSDSIYCGATVIVADDLSAESMIAALPHRPTVVLSSPPALATLATVIERIGPDLVAELRFVRAGSAALRPGLAERLQRVLDTKILQGYGMSEAGKIACTAIDGSSPPGSVGKPLAVELRIVEGEIVVRGDSVAPGVLVDGWFRTGDLGELDDDGNLFLLGRADGVVSRGGVQVSLDRLEEALELHPRIDAALCTAVEHPSLGSDIVAGYVATPGPPFGATALREHLMARFPAPHVPSRFVALDQLPLTRSGKPSRRALADVVAVGAGSGGAGRLDGTELRLAALWREILGADHVVNADDDFFAIGGDSLQLLQLLLRVEDEFGVELLPGEVIGQSSLASMADLVRDSTGRRQRPVLIPLRSGEDVRLPLYLVPGAGGSLATLQRFVFGLTEGRKVLGFESPGLYGGERPVKRIDELARRYVDELLADTGGRPFALMGMSMGAVVAHDMACELEARGQTPTVLVLGDCPPGPRVAARGKHRTARRRLKAALRRVVRRGRGVHPRIRRHRIVMRSAASRHRTRTTSARTVVFTTEQTRARTGDPLIGWGPFLTGDTTTVEFPGTHRELIRTRAHETAPALNSILVEEDGTPPDLPVVVGV